MSILGARSWLRTKKTRKHLERLVSYSVKGLTRGKASYRTSVSLYHLIRIWGEWNHANRMDILPLVI